MLRSADPDGLVRVQLGLGQAVIAFVEQMELAPRQLCEVAITVEGVDRTGRLTLSTSAASAAAA